MFDALRNTPDLKACIANVETSPGQLLNKAVARFALVDIGTVQARVYTAQQREKIITAVDGMKSLVERINFADTPHDLLSTVRGMKDFGARLLVLDYLQRIELPTKPGERHRDKRTAVDATMSFVREIAHADCAVLMLSAVGRTRDGRGKAGYSADRMGLGSFKESSECEYGADDAYILSRDTQFPDVATLHHLKSRFGPTASVTLNFEANYQRFVPFAGNPTTAAQSKTRNKSGNP